MSEVKNKLVVGILAHVDAGKTTLAESIMYLSGGIRKLGRVDHGDAFLDTHELEKARGITIFSKQAEVTLHTPAGERALTILDTPGHVDFSAETERTLQVLDAAILVISGADGVQGHVQVLWKLLKRHNIPVFLFVNKMDQPGTDKEALLAELRAKLDESCVDFTMFDEAFYDSVAMSSEAAMEEYLESGSVSDKEIMKAIEERNVFPCYFGSALKITGVEEFLEGIVRFASVKLYPEEFGARVYKISRDTNGTRLTHLKVTGGTLKVKSMSLGEKADQLRIYSGAQFSLAEEVKAGGICAVTGLSETYAGQGIAAEGEGVAAMLIPVLNYRIILPEGCDEHKMLKNLYLLEEEIPELHIVWDEKNSEIHAQVMGEVQVEILRSLIMNRFGVEVEFGEGSIVYKETITETVEGIGHFEPLRHYAEVHLLMEPGESGSGLVLEADCSTDELDLNWQRLILTHLEERKHPGVLTGSEITDMKITLIAGRAHMKHTEGGDFRQATYRAVRHGLKCTTGRLLEPVYEYRLEIPTECIGRAMNDIQRMYGNFDDPETFGEMSVLTGSCPVVTMNGYAGEVISYTRGKGRLSCTFKCYQPCHNEEDVIANIGYDSESDLENPTGSVFCAHGAGYVVPWYEVTDHAHVVSSYQERLRREEGREASLQELSARQKPSTSGMERVISRDEIEEIFLRTYGNRGKDKNPWNRPAAKTVTAPKEVEYKPKKAVSGDKYLLVDGYNIIFAWEDLNKLSEVNVEGARNKLLDIMCNYQGYTGATVIVVFDAYKVKGNPGSVQKYHNIHVVYTKEAETADQYIEKTVHKIAKKNEVTVATSDALEQMIIWGAGASRMSALGLRAELENMDKEKQGHFRESNLESRFFPFKDIEINVED